MTEYTVKVDANGTEEWYLDGKRHRKDGPAVENSNGYKAWHLDGKFHREDGPAIIYPNGDKYWYLNDELHRLDGPAIEWSDGDKWWYLNGKELTEDKYKKVTRKTKKYTVSELEELLPAWAFLSLIKILRL